MTQAQAAPSTPATPPARKKNEPFIGVDTANIDQLDSIGLDPNDVSAGAPMNYTVLGIKTDEGGYMISEREDGTPVDKPFEARPQMQIHFRIDDADFDFKDNPIGMNRISIPPVKKNDAGKWVRGKMRDGSAQQIFMAYLERIGISNNADLATTLKLVSLADLVGIQVHCETMAFPNPMVRRDPEAKPLRVAVWDNVFGYDNEVRKTAKLPPMARGENGVWSAVKR